MANKERIILGNPEPKVQRNATTVVKYEKGGGNGGFRPDADKTVLGTMNTIMKEKFNK